MSIKPMSYCLLLSLHIAFSFSFCDQSLWLEPEWCWFLTSSSSTSSSLCVSTMCVLVTVLLTMQRPWGHSVSHGTEEVAESSSFWWEGRRKRGRERDSMGFWNPKAHSTYFLQQGHTSQSFQIVPHPGDQFARPWRPFFLKPHSVECHCILVETRGQLYSLLYTGIRYRSPGLQSKLLTK